MYIYIYTSSVYIYIYISGARQLETGPLSDLRSLLFRYISPWQIDKIMHIGLINDPTKFRNIKIDENIDINGNILEKKNSKKFEKKNIFFKPQIYFQWCTYTDEMKKVGLGNILIEYDLVFSDVCETVWFGDFVA
jgi:hypothetical protein